MEYNNKKGYGSAGNNSYGAVSSRVNYADSQRTYSVNLGLEGYTSNIGTDNSYRSSTDVTRTPYRSLLDDKNTLDKVTSGCTGNCSTCPRRLEHGRLL